MNDIVQRKTLSKRGFAGFTAIVGGVGLLVMAASNVLGFLVGGLLTVGGLSVCLRKDDRRLGLTVTGAGVLGILSGAISGFPGAVLGLAGSGLIAYGGVSIYRFLRGLKSRM
mgnify:CR=1 FL=1